MDEALPILILIAAIIAIVWVVTRLYRLTEEVNRLREELRAKDDRLNEQEIESLKFVVNPHSFRNVLQHIQANTLKTHKAVERLSTSLDYMLYESDDTYVALDKEGEFLANFVELNKTLVPPVCIVKADIEGLKTKDKRWLIAPMVTAYFVENAFKHGQLRTDDDFIQIKAEMRDSEFMLSVRNTVGAYVEPGENEEKTGGIGHDNLVRRLAILYPKKHHIDYKNEGGVFTANMKLTLHE